MQTFNPHLLNIHVMDAKALKSYFNTLEVNTIRRSTLLFHNLPPFPLIVVSF